MLDQLGRKNQVDEKIGLSGPQIEAVERKSGPLLVAADAGSGKTGTFKFQNMNNMESEAEIIID